MPTENLQMSPSVSLEEARGRVGMSRTSLTSSGSVYYAFREDLCNPPCSVRRPNCCANFPLMKMPTENLQMSPSVSLEEGRGREGMSRTSLTSSGSVYYAFREDLCNPPCSVRRPNCCAKLL
ncbi:hypothetical protein CDAR_613391 [Caerostris darwini]|uniref:Uncharacterized protein n=1 Tax=Caerostris darwini TaxID=1538125 RepID=A0AAV4UNG1_9ARAC|nr:hypothetical protein CDAR_613391 [Caerostris darwini]